MDESLLAQTIDEAHHPFQKGSNESVADPEAVYLPEGGVYTTRTKAEGYEMNEMPSLKLAA